MQICFHVFSWREYWLRKLKCFISKIHNSWRLFPWRCRIDIATYLSIWLICSLFYIWIFVSFFQVWQGKFPSFWVFKIAQWIVTVLMLFTTSLTQMKFAIQHFLFSLFLELALYFFMKYLQSAIHFPLTQHATWKKGKKKSNTILIILFLFVYLFLIQNLLYYTCQGRCFWVLWAVTRCPVLVISAHRML